MGSNTRVAALPAVSCASPRGCPPGPTAAAWRGYRILRDLSGVPPPLRTPPQSASSARRMR
eukprot:12729454-Alexandrium_andersonii.AAC.1